ncbi:MFS general substrate transporter [Acaromyces ingoldii]|uniref:MFS general substrate transporter n=1 Tax=Acaromyces ingoldii TaxID=215250 RepID=A0A316YDE3_9BASI|nr:MFS general substrate transporter [Acaromyces ingoldii]PWN87222.1 MFS general substrate transporter [Acaromyces ingoldii]
MSQSSHQEDKSIQEEKLPQEGKAHQEEEEEEVGEREHRPIGHFHFRSVAFQILVVSATAFCTIGSFNALQGLGGAGQESPYVANAATSLNFGLLGVVCLFGGPIVAILGPRWSLAIGTMGDPLFGAAVYCNTRYGTQWFLVFAAVLRGIASGHFWCAEGSLIIGYPRAQHRGRSITTWVFFKELGGIVSSSIYLGLSAKDNKAGHFGYSVYYVTIAIMCAGLPIALLLSPTNKVRHADGTPLDTSSPAIKRGTWREEYARLLRLLSRRDVALILPFALYAYFYYSFAHTYNTRHFSVRGRSLVSLLTEISSVLGSLLVACFVDRRRQMRGIGLVTAFVLVICAAFWAYFAWAALAPPAKRLDWSDPDFARYAMSIVLVFLSQQSAQTYLYWVAAHLSDSLDDVFHLAGAVRGIESLGQCIAYGINASKTSPIVSVAMNLALYAVGAVCLVVLLVDKSRAKQAGASSAASM